MPHTMKQRAIVAQVWPPLPSEHASQALVLCTPHSGAEAILEQGLLFIIFVDKDGPSQRPIVQSSSGAVIHLDRMQEALGPHSRAATTMPRVKEAALGREISGQHAGGLGDLSASSQTIVLRQ